MIDVVIVAKNEERHIGTVLKALHAQTNLGTPVKVIVVDNGSTDRTRELATENGAQVIKCEGSLGHARNHGIRFGANRYVAFLDGHSVPSTHWASTMLQAFATRSDIGGCMGAIENVCARPGAQMFAKESIFASPEKLWKNTVSGLNATLPWIPTGNCVYLRAALESVGGFTESLFRCEDTDLSWKVVLKGYHLAYQPNAKVVHYDESGATGYWRKYYNYGAGAAELAERYNLKPNTRTKKKLRGSRLLLDIFYNLGFKTHQLKLTDSDLRKVDARFRTAASWQLDYALAVSRSVIFWYPTEELGICVNLENNTRIELTDSGLQIFRMLEEGCTRAQIISRLNKEYDVSETDAATDVDEFVEYLFGENMLTKVPSASTDPKNESAATAVAPERV